MKGFCFKFLLFLGVGAAPMASAETLALKDFRELPVSFSVATGVNHRDAEVQAVYNRVRTRLPLDGSVTHMSSPMVLAVIELAGVFCDKMIKSDAEINDEDLRQAHRMVDFRRGPRSLDDGVIESVVDEYAALFWQREATDTEFGFLKQALMEARDASASNQAAATIEVLKVGCSSAATSLAALLN